MTEAAWAALTMSLALLGVLYTTWAWRRRGPRAGVRGAGLTLLPVSAYLTGTLEMFTEVTGSVVDWATSLVLSPVVWTGIALFGVSLLLLVVAGRLPERRRTAAGTAGPGSAAAGGRPPPGALPPASRPAGPPLDDDLADIEEILRRRGIT